MLVSLLDQWACWDGIRKFEKEKHDYLQGQIGNPEGADKPNKKFYDPRVWLRKAEESAVERLGVRRNPVPLSSVMFPLTGGLQGSPLRERPWINV